MREKKELSDRKLDINQRLMDAADLTTDPTLETLLDDARSIVVLTGLRLDNADLKRERELWMWRAQDAAIDVIRLVTFLEGMALYARDLPAETREAMGKLMAEIRARRDARYSAPDDDQWTPAQIAEFKARNSTPYTPRKV